MRRPLIITLATLTVALAACGEDADPVERDRFTGAAATSPAEEPGDAPGPLVTTLTDLETLLQERGELDLVRTGGSELGPQAGVPFLDHTRYEESQAGLELDVWILADEHAARRARANLSDAEVVRGGARLARGCNVVVLHTGGTVGTELERRVNAVLAGLTCPAGAGAEG